MAVRRDVKLTGRPVTRALGLLRDVLLVACAALGVLTVSWWVFSHFTGAALVVVRTGSMSPAIPQGAVVVAMPVEAARIEVGDVVTVRLDDASPLITHRVVEISGTGTERELVLRGDANDTPDLYPYRVDRALRAVHSVDGGAVVLDTARSPVGVAVTAVVVGGLLGWALWPAREPDDEPTAVPVRSTGG